MYCSSCGKQVSDSAVFCPNCGIKIGGKRQPEQPEKSAPSGSGVSIPAALREEDGSDSTVYLAPDKAKKMFSRPAPDNGSGTTEYIPSHEDPDSSQTVYMPSDDDVFSEKTVYMPGDDSSSEPDSGDEEEIYTAPTEMLGENVINADEINAPVKPSDKKSEKKAPEKKVSLGKKEPPKQEQKPVQPIPAPLQQNAPVQQTAVQQNVPVQQTIPVQQNVPVQTQPFAPQPEQQTVENQINEIVSDIRPHIMNAPDSEPPAPVPHAQISPLRIAKEAPTRASNPTPSRRRKKKKEQEEQQNTAPVQPQPIQQTQPAQPAQNNPFANRPFDDNDETQIIPPVDSYEREVIQSLPPQQQYQMMDEQANYQQYQQPPQPVQPPMQMQPPPPEYVGNAPMQPQQQPAPPAPAKSSKPGAGRVFGAFIVSFLAFVCLLALSLLLCIRLGASGDMLYKRISKLDADTILSAETNNTEVAEDIFNKLGFSELTNGQADKNSFRTYMAELGFIDFAADKAKDYADYIIDGKGSDPTASSDEITDIFRAGNRSAQEAFGSVFNNDDFNKLKVRIENEGFTDDISIKQWSSDIGFELKNASYIFSYITLGIILALVLVLLIWTAVILDRKGRYIMGFYGNVFFWSGLIMFLGGIALLAGSAVAYSMTSEVVFYLCSNVLMPFSCFALCTGAAELFLGLIFKRIKKAKKNKTAKANS